MFKFKSIIAITAVSLSLFSCNKDEISNENPQSGTETTDGWIPMSVNVTAVAGEEESDGVSSRTPEDVDDYDRPKTNYLLNYIGIISKDPTTQPTAENIGEVVDFEFTTRSAYQEHAFNADGTYNPYFKIVSNPQETTASRDAGLTQSGTLHIANAQNGVIAAESTTEIILTVVEKEKLKDYIVLNDLAYGKTSSPRGSSFYYSSYDTDNYALTFHLPEIEKGAFDKYDVLSEGKALYDEYGDRLFNSDEFIAIADETYLYFYRVVNKDNVNGGYFRVAQFNLDSGDTPVNKLDLGLYRQSAIVNVSFVLVDKEMIEGVSGSYVKSDENGIVDEEASIISFKEKYGLDLTGMTCPYATMDGILRSYQIASTNNTKIGRLLLWADGYQTVAPDGKKVKKFGVFSGERGFRLKGHLVRGLGISGKSYSVVFPNSNSANQQNEPICFYVTVDNVNIRVVAASSVGLAFNMNYTYNVVVMINAADFAEAVSEIKNSPETRSSNEYVDFIVPSENVILQ